MKVKYELVEKRRKELLSIIKDAQAISTCDLLNQAGVSNVTIRRDLVYLEERNCISRYHGGCTFLSDLNTDKRGNGLNIKEMLAQKAAAMVEEGDILFINSSSTALQVIKYITGKHVTIITNNARALVLDHDPFVSLNFTGGEIRFPKEVMVGDLAISTLNKIIANKAIMGCSGLDVSTGITTANASEVSVNQAMISHTRGKVIILADHTKLGIRHSFCSGSLEDINILITDSEADPGMCEAIAEKDIEIIKV